MGEKINNREQGKRRSTSLIGIGLGSMLLVAFMALGGCKTSPSPGTVVKNSSGMEFAFIPAGSFKMGSEKIGEGPIHQVTFAKGFYIGRYEVTRAQWQKVMGTKPSFIGDDPSSDKSCAENCPVNSVTWNDAQEFIKKLNAANDGYTYRLPSEAEWEYACRAGTTGDYAGDLDSMAWYDKGSGDHGTHPVGQKKPNAWGLYDMHGNEPEWVMDYFHDTYDGGAPTDGSAWLTKQDLEVRGMRGGSWDSLADAVRSAHRDRGVPDAISIQSGIRLVAAPR